MLCIGKEFIDFTGEILWRGVSICPREELNVLYLGLTKKALLQRLEFDIHSVVPRQAVSSFPLTR